jgi:hypothetical protein
MRVAGFALKRHAIRSTQQYTCGRVAVGALPHTRVGSGCTGSH